MNTFLLTFYMIIGYILFGFACAKMCKIYRHKTLFYKILYCVGLFIVIVLVTSILASITSVFFKSDFLTTTMGLLFGGLSLIFVFILKYINEKPKENTMNKESKYVNTSTKKKKQRKPKSTEIVDLEEPTYEESFSKTETFETKVNNKKIIPTKSGILVQSYGEKKIADFLIENDIDFNYDKQITLTFNEPNKYGHKQEWVRPDFYLPELAIIIEYWGMKGDPDYDEKQDWKERKYAESKTKYISIYKEDLPDLKDKLDKKLKRYGINP